MKLIACLAVLFILIALTSIMLLKNSSDYELRVNQPSICGNNICERNEETYCLDCNLSCKSEFCNSKINIICKDYNFEKELLQKLFDNQEEIYSCLSNYYNYSPQRLVYHTITNISLTKEPCNNNEGCYVKGGNFGEKEGIIQEQIPGWVNFGQFEVKKKENVGFEIHELAHAFTYYGLGRVPSWFNEGISIYSESKLVCHEKQFKKDDIKETYDLYTNPDITIPLEEYEKTKESNHVIGARYFGYLEEEYGCNKECVSEILYQLYAYRQNYTKNDLRIDVINNKIIKQKSEEVIGKDLTGLFNLLKID